MLETTIMFNEFEPEEDPLLTLTVIWYVPGVAGAVQLTGFDEVLEKLSHGRLLHRKELIPSQFQSVMEPTQQSELCN